MISGVSEILINTWKPDVVMNESNVYLCKKKKKKTHKCQNNQPKNY